MHTGYSMQPGPEAIKNLVFSVRFWLFRVMINRDPGNSFLSAHFDWLSTGSHCDSMSKVLVRAITLAVRRLFCVRDWGFHHPQTPFPIVIPSNMHIHFSFFFLTHPLCPRSVAMDQAFRACKLLSANPRLICNRTFPCSLLYVVCFSLAD
jgi:hypothetical protein